jgi:hypothetical protein
MTTLCAIFRVPASGQDAFKTYEDAVLPLLADHGGALQRRLRTEDGGAEVHIIRFQSASQVEAYRADPRRIAHSGLFDASGAVAEVLTVDDV